MQYLLGLYTNLTSGELGENERVAVELYQYFKKSQLIIIFESVLGERGEGLLPDRRFTCLRQTHLMANTCAC